jgi:Histidine kinase
MLWLSHHKVAARYWLKVFAVYALVEAVIQLLFLYLLNNFGTRPISNIEIHLLMWLFQCLLIWPIWWVAWSVRKKTIIIQVIVNLVFYIAYSYLWFGPVQDAIGYLHNELQQITRTENNRVQAILDSGNEYSYLNYQLLKHAFRISWFYLAAYFYNYMQEEKKRTALAVANRELQLKMLTWHLNPSFYFNTISHLQQVAKDKPAHATEPILQLAKVMEYVIYEAKERMINVKKEVQFLNNYIQLKNQQLDNHSAIEIEVEGEHEKLKIAPLLLTGIIDKIMVEDNLPEKRKRKMLLQFSSNELQMVVNADSSNGNPVLKQDDSIHIRLKELYSERYSVSYSTDRNEFKLRIQLDEE